MLNSHNYSLGGDTIKTIVFIGCNKSGSSREAIKAASSMGYYTVLLTSNLNQLQQRSEYNDVHLMQYCDFSNLEKVKETIKQLQEHSLNVKAIISFVDPYCGLAAYLSKEFGLNNFTVDAIYNMQNKLQSRQLLKDTPYIPKYVSLTSNMVNLTNDIEKLFPVVIKYIDSNGSKDVYYADNRQTYYQNIKRITSKYPYGTILVEQYLEGPQYIVEALVINKKVHIVAVIEQDVEFVNGHFIITGYSLYIDDDKEFMEKLQSAVDVIIAKHRYESGPCHLEMRLVDDNWKLIEINPRISGAGMNTFLEIGLGYSLVKETLNLALDEPVNITPRFKKPTYAKYIIINVRGKLVKVTGESKVIEKEGVKYVYIKPKKGTILNPPSSMGDRYAYVIANGSSKKNAKKNAEEAASLIQFHLSRL